MRWLTDENIPHTLTSALRALGHDVLDVGEQTLDGYFTVVSLQGLRQRPLPETA
ncbi:MAG: DUF5615 family PIN-like protein [Xanthomonadaceae bacterium]|nr:DUF5615 family PIN-like protein [Xanthomonadaceae bacterium]MDP2184459.1 DUF5615 family PIN-like protein [Xanthomonadales bacterium]MDZ4114568.1 DUF5615 family PIN-like protein [Xanthomonadaceae bacterium]MDZ4377985.1 DUF5615 family PIN-like protein [Xanthomonadaceae bacterium]